MKKMTIVLLCCLLLTGCKAPAPKQSPATDSSPNMPTEESSAPTVETEASADATEEATEETAETETVSYTVYIANENLDGFSTQIISGEALTPLEALQEAGVIAEDVILNSAELEDGALAIDLSSAFRDQMMTQGSTGEWFLMGSLVNTFLAAYEADTVSITVDGEILESGHVIYDFPMEYFE